MLENPFDVIERRLNRIEDLLVNLEKPKISPPEKYLSRQETAQALHITLPTLHIWTKEGRLQSYRIGSRILYKANEVMAAAEATKYKRA